MKIKEIVQYIDSLMSGFLSAAGKQSQPGQWFRWMQLWTPCAGHWKTTATW